MPLEQTCRRIHYPSAIVHPNAVLHKKCFALGCTVETQTKCQPPKACNLISYVTAIS